MTYNPLNIAGAEVLAELPPKDHNQPEAPAYLAIFQQIDDLFGEATNFADGEPIDSDELAIAMTELYDKLHALGRQADELRVEEKRPLDEKVNEIQSRYNKYIQPKKGKVDLAKSALGTLLAAWRSKKASAAKAEADRIAAEAAEATRIATEAIRASSGNLAARAEAEELLAGAKKLEKTAARTFKAATTGTGLRSTWVASIADEEAALEWAYTLAPGEFMALALSMAQEKVRSGTRTLPGFAIVEEKTASVGRG